MYNYIYTYTHTHTHTHNLGYVEVLSENALNKVVSCWTVTKFRFTMHGSVYIKFWCSFYRVPDRRSMSLRKPVSAGICSDCWRAVEHQKWDIPYVGALVETSALCLLGVHLKAELLSHITHN